MKIAVEGCAHGELDKIYETLGQLEADNNMKVDLLIICGDFQAVRNKSDLVCMAVPPKYQKLNTFYKYYSGEKVAPVLTIFIGGNHEASNYLSELPYGGWVCPNIFYMGYSNVLNVNGVRIGGLSGIYKGQDYLKGHFEIIPYDDRTKRSVYHIRNIDVFRLKQIKTPVDIFVSHDWPRGICDYGDKEGLLRFKPFFKEDIENGRLGSRPTEEILRKLQPTYWFAAHLHCKFAALVPHEGEDGQTTFTKFLALDKCLPRKRFLQVLDIGKPVDNSDVHIKYDPEWLSILRITNHLLNTTPTSSYMPGVGCHERYNFSPTEEEIAEIEALFPNGFSAPKNFAQTASPHDAKDFQKLIPDIHKNSQTTEFCKILGIDDPVELILRGPTSKLNLKEYSIVDDLNVTATSQASLNPDEESQLSSGDESFEIHSSDCDTTGSSGFFYIDKKPGSCGTAVPSAMSFDERFALFEKSLDSAASSNNSLNEKFPEFIETKEEKPAESSDKIEIDQPTPCRIFKRRNQSMYNHNEEEDKESD